MDGNGNYPQYPEQSGNLHRPGGGGCLSGLPQGSAQPSPGVGGQAPVRGPHDPHCHPGRQPGRQRRSGLLPGPDRPGGPGDHGAGHGRLPAVPHPAAAVRAQAGPLRPAPGQRGRPGGGGPPRRQGGQLPHLPHCHCRGAGDAGGPLRAPRRRHRPLRHGHQLRPLPAPLHGGHGHGQAGHPAGRHQDRRLPGAAGAGGGVRGAPWPSPPWPASSSHWG